MDPNIVSPQHTPSSQPTPDNSFVPPHPITPQPSHPPQPASQFHPMQYQPDAPAAQPFQPQTPPSFQQSQSFQHLSPDTQASAPPNQPAHPMFTSSAQPPNYSFTGSMHPAGPMPGIPRRRHKKLFLAGGTLATLLLLSGGFVFGYYMPNQPDAVYKTGLNRSAKALDKIVVGATETSKLETFKKSEVTLSVDAKYGDFSLAGSINAKFDATKSNGSVDFTSKQTGETDKKYKAQFRTELPAGSEYPNVYLQFTGLTSLNIDNYIPGASAYEGKWISIMSDYLKSLGTVPTAEETNKKQLTAQDYAELARAATSVTTDYVFSTQTDKAVFEKKSFVGKEKTDGLNTYHYKVGLNKDHVKAYCKALVNKIYSTEAFKKLPGVDEENVKQSKASTARDCDNSGNNIKDSTEYDLWVETNYKLIYKIRIPDTFSKDAYTDIGQIYKGGDEVTLFAAYHDGKTKTDGKFTLLTNLKSNITKGTLTFSGGEGTNTYNATVILDAKPYTGEIDASKPSGAISIEDVLKKLNIDPYQLFGGLSGSKAGLDTERQTDIKALHGQVEAYYAQFGYYPSLANLNDSAWVSANLKGMDKEALRDPKGTGYTLASTPAANVYSYAATGSGGKPCTNATPAKQCLAYTLTSKLTDGTSYTKFSLNN